MSSLRRSRSPSREGLMGTSVGSSSIINMTNSTSSSVISGGSSSSMLPTADATNPATTTSLRTTATAVVRNGFRRARSGLRSPMSPITNGVSNGVSNGYGGNRGGNSNGTSSGSGQAFNPKLIFGQIVSLQCFHYVIWSVLVQINSLVFRNTAVSMDRLFSDYYLRVWNASGWPDLMAVLLSSACGSVLLAIIVEKAKKCLDFGLTLFVIHLMVCTMYMHHFPHTWDWWLVHIAGTIGMILGGEHLCARRELDDIPLLTL